MNIRQRTYLNGWHKFITIFQEVIYNQCIKDMKKMQLSVLVKILYSTGDDGIKEFSTFLVPPV